MNCFWWLKGFRDDISVFKIEFCKLFVFSELDVVVE